VNADRGIAQHELVPNDAIVDRDATSSVNAYEELMLSSVRVASAHLPPGYSENEEAAFDRKRHLLPELRIAQLTAEIVDERQAMNAHAGDTR
jgi:hypothetical protein